MKSKCNSSETKWFSGYTGVNCRKVYVMIEVTQRLQTLSWPDRELQQVTFLRSERNISHTKTVVSPKFPK